MEGRNVGTIRRKGLKQGLTSAPRGYSEGNRDRMHEVRIAQQTEES